jgi:hypothetical protein
MQRNCGLFVFLLRRRFLRGCFSVPSSAIEGGPARLRMWGTGSPAFSVDITPVGDRWNGRPGRVGLGDVGGVAPLPGTATKSGSESVRNAGAPTITYQCLTPQRPHPEILAGAVSSLHYLCSDGIMYVGSLQFAVMFLCLLALWQVTLFLPFGLFWGWHRRCIECVRRTLTV